MNGPSFLRSGSDRSADRKLVAAVGYVAVALAVVTAFVPVVGDVIAGSIGLVVGSPVVIILAALFGGGYGLLALYRTGQEESTRRPLVEREPERAHYSENHVAGEGIDESVEAVNGELPESAAKNWWSYREKSDVKGSMKSVAVDVLAREHDVSREEAMELVADGSWTDDTRAATFIADEGANALPLRIQFLDWLSGKAYERRVEATVDVIAEHAGLERDVPRDEGGNEPAEGSVGSDESTENGASPEDRASLDDSTSSVDANSNGDWAVADEDAIETARTEGATVTATAAANDADANSYPVNDGGEVARRQGGDDA